MLRVTESESGIIEFVSETNAVQKELAPYKFERQGASIFMSRHSDHQLLACFNPFDNTLFVCHPDGFELANKFGTKRFPVGQARTQFDEKQVTNAIKFKRDLSCPVLSETEVKLNGYAAVSLNSLLEKNGKQFYNQMADLFARCADFTSEKQIEYATDLNDRFCRLNVANEQPHNNIVTEHVFLVDAKTQQVVGTVSATISVDQNGAVDVYFYDEIVDYFTKLDAHKAKALMELFNQYKTTQYTTADESKNAHAERRKAIAAIATVEEVDLARMDLMKSLFAAARAQIKTTLGKLKATQSHMQMDKIRGFIRAADGREAYYINDLGCSSQNQTNYVIHGAPTEYAKLLDKYVKTWAAREMHRLNFSSAHAHPASLFYYNSKEADATVIHPAALTLGGM